MRLDECSSQNTKPHARQWCRRSRSEKALPQPEWAQCVAFESEIQWAREAIGVENNKMLWPAKDDGRLDRSDACRPSSSRGKATGTMLEAPPAPWAFTPSSAKHALDLYLAAEFQRTALPPIAALPPPLQLRAGAAGPRQLPPPPPPLLPPPPAQQMMLEHSAAPNRSIPPAPMPIELPPPSHADPLTAQIDRFDQLLGEVAAELSLGPAAIPRQAVAPATSGAQPSPALDHEPAECIRGDAAPAAEDALLATRRKLASMRARLPSAM